MVNWRLFFTELLESAVSRFGFLRTGVTAAVLSETGTVAERKDLFKKCEIGAEMTEEQYFKRKVGAGSNRHEEELEFCINSLIMVELVKVKLLKSWIVLRSRRDVRHADPFAELY